MRTLVFILVGVLLATPTLAQESRQFDLGCNGTSEDIRGGRTIWSDRIRVDLDRNIYCWRNCTVRARIAEVAEGVIWFSRGGDFTSVNRITGAFEHLPGLIGREPKITGTCRVLPSTPITERAF